jgi:hypothetical protein
MGDLALGLVVPRMTFFVTTALPTTGGAPVPGTDSPRGR